MTLYPPAKLSRRLGALLYDVMTILALLLAVGFIWVGINKGEQIEPGTLYSKLLQVSMFLTPMVFYLYFWLRDGQTLGMRAWRLRIQRFNGQPITPQQAIIRLLVAPFSLFPLGLGYFWMNFTPTYRTWHDSLSQTEIVQLPKKD